MRDTGISGSRTPHSIQHGNRKVSGGQIGECRVCLESFVIHAVFVRWCSTDGLYRNAAVALSKANIIHNIDYGQAKAIRLGHNSSIADLTAVFIVYHYRVGSSHQIVIVGYRSAIAPRVGVAAKSAVYYGAYTTIAFTKATYVYNVKIQAQRRMIFYNEFEKTSAEVSIQYIYLVDVGRDIIQRIIALKAVAIVKVVFVRW